MGTPWLRRRGRGAGPRVQVGRFIFDERTLELFDGERPVPLQPKPTLVLAELIAARGSLVEREQLYDVAWGDTVVEFDLALNRCIRDIRAAVGDDAKAPWFLDTVPRRGYRVIAPVGEVRHGGLPRRVRRTLASALGAAVLVLSLTNAGERSETSLEGQPTIVTFQSYGSDVAGIDAAIGDEVRRQLALGSRAPHSTGLLVNGVIVPAPDGALLEVTMVRLSDGEPIWRGRYNPLCDRISGDATRLIGRLISREVMQRS